MQPSTTYYVRTYATNATGTVYGEQRTVSTPKRNTFCYHR